VRNSHESGNRVVDETFPPSYPPETVVRDNDLLAARLGLSEVQVGHKCEESFLVLWFEAVDLQGIEMDEGNPAALRSWCGIQIRRGILSWPVFLIRWGSIRPKSGWEWLGCPGMVSGEFHSQWG
jgi:hypothetical protein